MHNYRVVASNKTIDNENGKANLVAEDEPCLDASVWMCESSGSAASASASSGVTVEELSGSTEVSLPSDLRWKVSEAKSERGI